LLPVNDDAGGIASAVPEARAAEPDSAVTPAALNKMEAWNPPAASRAGTALPALADRYQVVMHVDAAALREGSEAGQSALLGGARVAAETSRRLACDGSRSLMIDGAGGRTVAASAMRRTVPPALRRTLDWRDRGCRFPGCGLRRCDAHHVQHWADGGATTLENLVLLCPRHHRAVHEEGYRVNMQPDGVPTFRRPDGRVLPDAPALAPPVGTALADTIAALAPAPWEAPGVGRLDVDSPWPPAAGPNQQHRLQL
jgi:hypothetical protein